MKRGTETRKKVKKRIVVEVDRTQKSIKKKNIPVLDQNQNRGSFFEKKNFF